MGMVAGIAVAGAMGALARWGLGTFVEERAPGFPWATLLINVSGSFALGLLFVLFTERSTISPELRTAIMVGFLGAYTTFSTFSLETVRLLEVGALGSAALNVGGSIVLGLAAAWLGMRLGRLA